MNTEITIGITTVVVIATAMITSAVIKIFRHAFEVPEGYAGLLYHVGKFTDTLGAGRHIRWGRHFTLGVQDLRKSVLLVAAQDVLTADNVGLKISLQIAYQVTDPARAALETQSWHTDLYSAGQLALRAVVGSVTMEALLGQRVDIGSQMLARVQPEAAKVGINVHAVEVKDMVLPPDLKRAFAEVLKAKQEGLAALERARGETAALRNLANAGRVLDGSPGLMNLRLMQTLTLAQHGGNTLVVGVPGGFVPLNNGKPGKPTPAPPVED